MRRKTTLELNEMICGHKESIYTWMEGKTTTVVFLVTDGDLLTQNCNEGLLKCV